MGKESKVRLIVDFVEGFALTWNPFTMALSVVASFLETIITKFETTPQRNVFYLLGALVGTLYSYYSAGTWFMEWDGIWWIPAGLAIVSALGIPVTWYFEQKETGGGCTSF